MAGGAPGRGKYSLLYCQALLVRLDQISGNWPILFRFGKFCLKRSNPNCYWWFPLHVSANLMYMYYVSICESRDDLLLLEQHLLHRAHTVILIPLLQFQMLNTLSQFTLRKVLSWCQKRGQGKSRCYYDEFDIRPGTGYLDNHPVICQLCNQTSGRMLDMWTNILLDAGYVDKQPVRCRNYNQTSGQMPDT